MKNKIISIIQALVLLWGVTSCHSPEELGSDIQREGINSITASFPNDDSSENSFKGEIDYTNHSITFIFPYNYPKLSDNVLPTSALKRVRLSASLANNVSVTPPLLYMDLTQDNYITVKDQTSGTSTEFKVIGEIRKSNECSITKFDIPAIGLLGVINENEKTISLVTIDNVGEQIANIDISLTQHHLGVTVTRQTPDIKCYGAYILDPKTGKVDTYLAKVTLMATGGVGAVYKTTTNPLVATGDGIAMVYRAKGTVKDMEFVQFHPTALYHPGDRPSFLITEAMRGYGGVLRTMDGKEFMQKYDPRLSLAPRDIVARAIDNEMKNRGDDHVYLDVTHKDPEETKKHFPNIYEKCLSLGIDITKDYIPVAPAAHYLCGGILVDLDGQSSIERLYAVGECSCTGLHGGNRLASNSLIEAVVYADAAAKHSLQVVDQYSYNENIPEWNDEGTRSPEEMVLITQSMKEVNQIMSTYVGIVRSDLRLKRAWDRLDIIYEETESLFKRSVASREICELRNMVNVGYLIMRQAMERKESRGLHYTIDYPHVKK